MGMFDFLFGSGDSMEKVQTLSPEQKQFLQQILGQLGGGGALGQGSEQAMGLLQQYLDPQSSVYKNFEKPYMQQFEQQTVPGLAERFAGGGAMGGGLSSSGFGQALSSAGSNLQTNLAQMKSGMQRNAIQDILGHYKSMAGLGLGTPAFGYQQTQGQPGLIPQLGGAALSGWASGGFQGLSNPFKIPYV